jgi:hypothetical protein
LEFLFGVCGFGLFYPVGNHAPCKESVNTSKENTKKFVRVGQFPCPYWYFSTANYQRKSESHSENITFFRREKVGMPKESLGQCFSAGSY